MINVSEYIRKLLNNLLLRYSLAIFISIVLIWLQFFLPLAKIPKLLFYVFVGIFIVWLVDSQKKIREEIRRQRTKQDLLTKAGKIIFSSLDFEITLNNVAKMIVPDIADWCTIDLIGKNGKIQQAVVMHSDSKKVEWAKDIRKRFSYQEQAKGGVGQVIKTKKSQLYPFISEQLLDKSIKNKEFLQIVKSMGIKSVMIVPVIAVNKSIGAITFVLSNSNKKYDQTDLRFAEDLANRIGQAIENSRLYLQAKEEIEERKAAERDLQEAKEQLEVILQNITDGITVQDKSGKLIFINDAAARLAGFNSRQNMIQVFNTPNKAVKYFKRYEMKDKDGIKVSPENLTNRRVLRGENKPEAIIQYYDTVTGLIRWSLTRSRPVLDEHNRLQFVVTIITDISREKELEHRKDEFISIASHELKTPLTSVKAYTQLLKFRLAPVLNKKFSSYLDKMERQIERLVNLVNELLDVTKIQAGKLSMSYEDFDCRDLVQDVIDTMKLITDKHKFLIHGDKKIIINADRSRIEQVFSNLLVNAVKYSPAGGNIEVFLKHDDKVLTAKVKDQGIGIAKEEHSTVFERFNQTNEKKKENLSGLGLGLYISLEIIKRHSGKIWVESEPNKGSTFIFTIPIKRQ